MASIVNHRRGERTNVIRDAKVRDVRSGRYLPARTLNVSDGGMLLAVRGGGYLPSGAPVEVAVAWSADQATVRGAAMTEARVVREAGRWGEECLIALATRGAARDLAAA